MIELSPYALKRFGTLFLWKHASLVQFYFLKEKLMTFLFIKFIKSDSLSYF